MYTIIILFIAVVLIIGIFCVAVVCRDLVLESRERKQRKSEQKTAARFGQSAEPSATPSVLQDGKPTEENAWRE